MWLVGTATVTTQGLPALTTRRTKSGDFNWPKLGTQTWPPVGTFSWPRTHANRRPPSVSPSVTNASQQHHGSAHRRSDGERIPGGKLEPCLTVESGVPDVTTSDARLTSTGTSSRDDGRPELRAVTPNTQREGRRERNTGPEPQRSRSLRSLRCPGLHSRPPQQRRRAPVLCPPRPPAPAPAAGARERDPRRVRPAHCGGRARLSILRRVLA